jgi:hypothetical protein
MRANSERGQQVVHFLSDLLFHGGDPPNICVVVGSFILFVRPTSPAADRGAAAAAAVRGDRCSQDES